MPEAAVHEDHGPEAREDNVGAAGKIATMQSVPITRRVDRAAHDHLGLGVLAADRGHNATTGGGDAASGHTGVSAAAAPGASPHGGDAYRRAARLRSALVHSRVDSRVSALVDALEGRDAIEVPVVAQNSPHVAALHHRDVQRIARRESAVRA
jgi:hypothetical protein